MRIGALEVGEPLEDLETMTVGVFMHGINKSAVLDPGAMVCVMHPTTYNQIPLGQRPTLQPLTLPLQGVSGHLVQPEGYASFCLEFKEGICLRQQIVVAEIDTSLLLGLNFFRKQGVEWDFKDATMVINGTVIRGEVGKTEGPKVWGVLVESETMSRPVDETCEDCYDRRDDRRDYQEDEHREVRTDKRRDTRDDGRDDRREYQREDRRGVRTYKRSYAREDRRDDQEVRDAELLKTHCKVY